MIHPIEHLPYALFFTSRRGFTLIEALIVVVIVAVLAAIAIPKFAQIDRLVEYRTACERAGGVYFRARGSSPLCLRRDLVIPVTDTVRP